MFYVLTVFRTISSKKLRMTWIWPGVFDPSSGSASRSGTTCSPIVAPRAWPGLSVEGQASGGAAGHLDDPDVGLGGTGEVMSRRMHLQRLRGAFAYSIGAEKPLFLPLGRRPRAGPVHSPRCPHIGSNRLEARARPRPIGPSTAPMECFR